MEVQIDMRIADEMETGADNNCAYVEKYQSYDARFLVKL